MGAVNCCVGGPVSCIGPQGAGNTLGPAFAFAVTWLLYTAGRIKTRGFSARFANFGRACFSSSRNKIPGGLARPGSRSGGPAALEQEFARREAPVGRRPDGKPSFYHKAPGARWGKNAVMAPQASPQDGQGVVDPKPAGGRFRINHGVPAMPATTGAKRLACHPAIILFSLFSAGFGPLGPKPPKFPDIAAKRAGPGG